ncbi:hypothetical protein M8C21_033397 [Ambrosia artemisiifolia]|uniref:Uncharacterized protein n=1 Tax=Ambrosia artemisiifolia TaxID=4212 RepID=A0AAD5CM59_AMBAR|nr:hypothetical protein M8C21_033397 [Ambrosia artemisiifolia]
MGGSAKSHRMLKDWSMNRVDDKEIRNIEALYDDDVLKMTMLGNGFRNSYHTFYGPG